MSTLDRFLNHTIKVLLVCITCIMLIIGLLFVTPVYVHAYSLSDLTSMGFEISAPNGGSVTEGSLTFSSGGQFRIRNNNLTPSSISFDVTVYSIDDNRRVQMSANIGSSAFTATSSNTTDFTVYNNRFVRLIQAGSATTHVEFNFTPDNGLTATEFNFTVTDSSYTSKTSGNCVLLISGISINGESADTVDLGPKEFDIPAGYAYYILTNGGSATLTTKFTIYNNIFTGSWSESNQRIGISESRVPSSGYTFGSDTGTRIPWHKLSTADTNILGQTHYAQYIYTNCPDNGNYLVIYNPVYAYDDDVTSNVNGTIHVEISNFVGANRFALRSSLGFNGSVDSVSPDDYSEFESTGTGDLVVGNDSSLMWYPATRTSEDVDSSSGSAAPAPTAPYNDTSSVPDNNTFLGNLVERIVSFLEAPISHIKSLQDAAANFMGWLANLWRWLPETVVVVIVDALIVLIVIGVVKFLWK